MSDESSDRERDSDCSRSDPVPTLAELLRSCIGRDVDVRRARYWPPDVFALCAVVLEDTGAYRLAVSPPKGETWPPSDRWPDEVAERAAEWAQKVEAWLEGGGGKIDPYAGSDPGGDMPPLLDHFVQHAAKRLDELADDWEFVRQTLDVLALADEASAGMGIIGMDHVFTGTHALVLLEKHATCSQLPPRRVRVVPKMRTPQCGIGLRSISMHLALIRGEVELTWRQLPNSMDWERMEVLLLPWPMEVTADDFATASAEYCALDANRFGFFAFRPKWELDAERVVQRVREAEDICSRVDMIVLPEAAIDRRELDAIRTSLFKAFGPRAPSILAGVRSTDESGRDQNLAVFTWVPAGATEWAEFAQAKHHRWYLDERQIKTYRLARSLHPGRKWWEGIELPARSLGFFALSHWLVFCPLVCEDLARQDPVAPIVRAAGPTLLIALLLDGPQVEQRWPGRYASVLADDPGTSVLTVSSFGMVQRSKAPGFEPSNVVGLWKDPVNGSRPIRLAPGADAVLMSIRVEWQEEWTADGRRDGGCAAVPVLQECWQLGTRGGTD